MAPLLQATRTVPIVFTLVDAGRLCNSGDGAWARACVVTL